ncbi:DUF4365 domain-containing protein [Arthrobacter sp. H35-D1]|uniref:DUF4365 domain-containing protein n=1 Tax=Arthrobacter sp. H35-D1 TaxID=3046202 RepID=UPI0024BA9E8D|nr:DUF4365 domain-containing protein [Arthrobacter sp. H35-D1]MDJ0314578.1 DUF4365 domain-containing protein [Arthrobacter sp. H35-D1]
MRAPKNESTGTSGESEVLAQFERLGWAGSIDGRHDTGTDLYLRPRDARRYELGAVMGAQVKTGVSYFNSPQKDAEGIVTGWWFAEDSHVHFDYWLRHALPHLVILRDQASNVSYWVHITNERVVSTGKGAKILVPASQLIDADQIVALSDIALTQLPSPNWHGTAWAGVVNLSPSDEIRHALITPRLVAPHPNLLPESITGLEALAMQVLLRDELERTLEPSEIALFADSAKWKGLPLEDARKAEDWCWRATAALHLWLYQGQATELLQLVEGSSNGAERAAATVVSCAYHFDVNDPDSALQALLRALGYDDYSPVDHAWLETQHARALLEIGQHENAFDLAMKTQRIHREVPSDVTSGAIAGSCALTAFRASGWMKGDIANFVQRSDNPASWWRAQVLSNGLSAHLSEEFRTWTENGSRRTGVSDRAHRRLVSAALLASYAGDQDGWRSATGSLAEHFLLATDSTSPTKQVANGLTRLRQSGDSKGTSRATRHIVSSGPTIAARMAALEVSLERSTRTTALSDLELLTAAGDVLEQAHADDICVWALATLQDPQNYIERSRPTFIVLFKIIDLLKSMVWSLSEKSLQSVIDYFFDQPPITEDSTAQTLASLIRAIPETAWQDSDRQRAAIRSKVEPPYLREAYLAVSAPTIVESREEIHDRALAGELIIFEAIADVQTLPGDAVEALIARLCGAVGTLIDHASKGLSYGSGGLDPGQALTLLGALHPSSSRWDLIEALLTSPHIRPRQQTGTLEVLAKHGLKLPDMVKAQLVEHVSDLRDREPQLDIFEEEDNRSLAAEAFASLTGEASRGQLVKELLTRDDAHRAAAARIIERFGDEADSGILLALAGDASETTRNSALGGLTKLVVAEGASHGVVSILAQILESGGRRSAAAVVSRLAGGSESKDVLELLAVALRHPSAQIRSVAHKMAES